MTLPLQPGTLPNCILIAEDNDSDLVLLQRALKLADVLCPVHAVSDGEEAIAYLNGEGKYANRIEYPLPSVVLLDLKMPRKDGFEVLQWIRGHLTFCRLPVLVLTISNQIADINRAYSLGANSFINKSLDYQSTKDLADSIRNYLPSRQLSPGTPEEWGTTPLSFSQPVTFPSSRPLRFERLFFPALLPPNGGKSCAAAELVKAAFSAWNHNAKALDKLNALVERGGEPVGIMAIIVFDPWPRVRLQVYCFSAI